MQALLIRQREKFDVFGRKHPKERKGWLPLRGNGDARMLACFEVTRRSLEFRGPSHVKIAVMVLSRESWEAEGGIAQRLALSISSASSAAFSNVGPHVQNDSEAQRVKH